MIKEQAYLITATALEPFRIGGKPDPLGPENPVATVAGRPVVPGPSLKGALRSALERWLMDQYYDPAQKKWNPNATAMQPCMAGTQLSDDEKRLLQEGRYVRDSCHYPCDVKTGTRDTRRHRCDHAHGICPVCYLLGAQGLTGFVRVPFLSSGASTKELYSARIDRATHTVAPGANRPYELVPEQSVFQGTLYVTLSDTSLGWELGKQRLLRQPTAGDEWLRDGLWTADRIINDMILPAARSINLLGGYKSKGFGRVETTIEPIK